MNSTENDSHVLAAGRNAHWLYVARSFHDDKVEKVKIERFSIADEMQDLGFSVTLNSLETNIDYELTVDKYNNVILLPKGTVPLKLDNDNMSGSGLGSEYVDSEGHKTKALKTELPEVGGCVNWKIVEAQSFSAIDLAHITAVAPESTVISSNLPSSIPAPSSSLMAYTETSAPTSSAAESMMVTPSQVSSPVPVTASPEPLSSDVASMPSAMETMTTMAGGEVTSPAVASTAMSSVPVTSQFSSPVEASTFVDQLSMLVSSPALVAAMTASSESMPAPSTTLPPAPSSMAGQASGMGSGLGGSSDTTPEQTVMMDNGSGSSGFRSGSGQVPGSGDALSSAGAVASALTSVVSMATQSSVRDETSKSTTAAAAPTPTPTSAPSQTIPLMEASSSGTILTTVDQMTTILSSLSFSPSESVPPVTSSLVNAAIPEQLSTFSASPTTTQVTEEDLRANGNVIKEVVLPVSGAVCGLVLTVVVVEGTAYCIVKHKGKAKKRRGAYTEMAIQNPVYEANVTTTKDDTAWKIVYLESTEL